MLAAAVVREDRRDEVRLGLRGLLLKGQDRLHWRDEDQPRRVRIATAIADLPVQSLVVVGARVVAARQERARRQALSRLLWELDRRQAEHLLLESRRDERDLHDVKAIGGFRNQQVLSRRSASITDNRCRNQCCGYPTRWRALSVMTVVAEPSVSRC